MNNTITEELAIGFAKKAIADFILNPKEYEIKVQRAKRLQEMLKEFTAPYQPKQDEWEVVELMDTHYGNKIINEYNKLSIFSLNDYFTKYPSGRFIPHKVRRLSDNTTLEVGKEYEIEGYNYWTYT